ncbi:ice-binding family protein [Nocardia sp. alder85J]|uniref:ice-binding family protein n=1 Tax=Nocardia sp. alder85J TaxID=2862949 RepID=UPI001CD1CC95|nr:ice-binding family protein [Nocardia sp. alder85J]MCX4093708.1 ice-binding family protein [Nocardia sp. alder85J]
MSEVEARFAGPLVRPRKARVYIGWLIAAIVATTAVTQSISSGIASAAVAPVGLGSAASFAVLGGTTVTNTGATTVSGNVGVSPGTAITGFPPGTVVNGALHPGDAVAAQAHTDLQTAYTDAAGRTPATPVTTDLGGQTLTPGVYKAAAGMSLNGTVTLDGQGDPNAVFILQAGSTLITGANSVVALVNGAAANNVFWQVGSSATLGTNTNFAGSILALTSITVTTGVTMNGRFLALNGAVTLDTDAITLPSTPPPPTPTTTTVSAPAKATKDCAVTLRATVAPVPNGGTVQFQDDGVDIGSPVPVSATGVATLSYTFTTTGAHSITAIYSGTLAFDGSTSAPVTVDVEGGMWSGSSGSGGSSGSSEGCKPEHGS